MSEPVEVWDQAAQVFEHIEPVIHEVRCPDPFAVLAFFRSLQAEAHVLARQPGELVKSMMFEPTACQSLDARPTLRDEPNSSLERLDELGKRVESAFGRLGE